MQWPRPSVLTFETERYKNYLIDHVTVSLHELQAFITYANEMLLRQVEPNDRHGLIEMMTFLSQVRTREGYTDDMAEPIKDTIELLKSYAYEVPQSIYALLDELPEQWLVIKKLTAKMRQHIAPLQANQMAQIRSQIIDMDRKQQELRETFLRDAPFKYDTVQPYIGKTVSAEKENHASLSSLAELDHWALQLRQFDHDVDKLTELASTFDISTPEYKT